MNLWCYPLPHMKAGDLLIAKISHNSNLHANVQLCRLGLQLSINVAQLSLLVLILHCNFHLKQRNYLLYRPTQNVENVKISVSFIQISAIYLCILISQSVKFNAIGIQISAIVKVLLTLISCNYHLNQRNYESNRKCHS